eukprot:ANDGO_04311.mRNA.1 Inositol 1
MDFPNGCVVRFQSNVKGQLRPFRRFLHYGTVQTYSDVVVPSAEYDASTYCILEIADAADISPVLRYGDVVRIREWRSDRYLCLNRALHLNIGYAALFSPIAAFETSSSHSRPGKVQNAQTKSNFTNDHTCFQVQPASKIRSTGDPVLSTDGPLFLLHLATSLYLGNSSNREDEFDAMSPVCASVSSAPWIIQRMAPFFDPDLLYAGDVFSMGHVNDKNVVITEPFCPPHLISHIPFKNTGHEHGGNVVKNGDAESQVVCGIRNYLQLNPADATSVIPVAARPHLAASNEMPSVADLSVRGLWVMEPMTAKQDGSIILSGKVAVRVRSLTSGLCLAVNQSLGLVGSNQSLGSVSSDKSGASSSIFDLFFDDPKEKLQKLLKFVSAGNQGLAENEALVADFAGSLIRGFLASPGRLYITTSRLVFDHTFKRDPDIVSIDSIKTVDNSGLGLIRISFSLDSASGTSAEEITLSIPRRDRCYASILTARETRAEQISEEARRNEIVSQEDVVQLEFNPTESSTSITLDELLAGSAFTDVSAAIAEIQNDQKPFSVVLCSDNEVESDLLAWTLSSSSAVDSVSRSQYLSVSSRSKTLYVTLRNVASSITLSMNSTSVFEQSIHSARFPRVCILGRDGKSFVTEKGDVSKTVIPETVFDLIPRAPPAASRVKDGQFGSRPLLRCCASGKFYTILWINKCWCFTSSYSPDRKFYEFSEKDSDPATLPLVLFQDGAADYIGVTADSSKYLRVTTQAIAQYLVKRIPISPILAYSVKPLCARLSVGNSQLKEEDVFSFQLVSDKLRTAAYAFRLCSALWSHNRSLEFCSQFASIIIREDMLPLVGSSLSSSPWSDSFAKSFLITMERASDESQNVSSAPRSELTIILRGLMSGNGFLGTRFTRIVQSLLHGTGSGDSLLLVEAILKLSSVTGGSLKFLGGERYVTSVLESALKEENSNLIRWAESMCYEKLILDRILPDGSTGAVNISFVSVLANIISSSRLSSLIQKHSYSSGSCSMTHSTFHHAVLTLIVTVASALPVRSPAFVTWVEGILPRSCCTQLIGNSSVPTPVVVAMGRMICHWFAAIPSDIAERLAFEASVKSVVVFSRLSEQLTPKPQGDLLDLVDSISLALSTSTESSDLERIAVLVRILTLLVSHGHTRETVSTSTARMMKGVALVAQRLSAQPSVDRRFLASLMHHLSLLIWAIRLKRDAERSDVLWQTYLKHQSLFSDTADSSSVAMDVVDARAGQELSSPTSPASPVTPGSGSRSSRRLLKDLDPPVEEEYAAHAQQNPSDVSELRQMILLSSLENAESLGRATVEQDRIIRDCLLSLSSASGISMNSLWEMVFDECATWSTILDGMKNCVVLESVEDMEYLKNWKDWMAGRSFESMREALTSASRRQKELISSLPLDTFCLEESARFPEDCLAMMPLLHERHLISYGQNFRRFVRFVMPYWRDFGLFVARCCCAVAPYRSEELVDEDLFSLLLLLRDPDVLKRDTTGAVPSSISLLISSQNDRIVLAFLSRSNLILTGPHMHINAICIAEAIGLLSRDERKVDAIRQVVPLHDLLSIASGKSKNVAAKFVAVAWNAIRLFYLSSSFVLSKNNKVALEDGFVCALGIVSASLKNVGGTEVALSVFSSNNSGSNMDIACRLFSVMPSVIVAFVQNTGSPSSAAAAWLSLLYRVAVSARRCVSNAMVALRRSGAVEREGLSSQIVQMHSWVLSTQRVGLWTFNLPSVQECEDLEASISRLPVHLETTEKDSASGRFHAMNSPSHSDDAKSDVEIEFEDANVRSYSLFVSSLQVSLSSLLERDKASRVSFFTDLSLRSLKSLVRDLPLRSASLTVIAIWGLSVSMGKAAVANSPEYRRFVISDALPRILQLLSYPSARHIVPFDVASGLGEDVVHACFHTVSTLVRIFAPLQPEEEAIVAALLNTNSSAFPVLVRIILDTTNRARVSSAAGFLKSLSLLSSPPNAFQNLGYLRPLSDVLQRMTDAYAQYCDNALLRTSGGFIFNDDDDENDNDADDHDDDEYGKGKNERSDGSSLSVQEYARRSVVEMGFQYQQQFLDVLLAILSMVSGPNRAAQADGPVLVSIVSSVSTILSKQFVWERSLRVSTFMSPVSVLQRNACMLAIRIVISLQEGVDQNVQLKLLQKQLDTSLVCKQFKSYCEMHDSYLSYSESRLKHLKLNRSYEKQHKESMLQCLERIKEEGLVFGALLSLLHMDEPPFSSEEVEREYPLLKSLGRVEVVLPNTEAVEVVYFPRLALSEKHLNASDRHDVIWGVSHRNQTDKMEQFLSFSQDLSSRFRRRADAAAASSLKGFLSNSFVRLWLERFVCLLTIVLNILVFSESPETSSSFADRYEYGIIGVVLLTALVASNVVFWPSDFVIEREERLRAFIRQRTGKNPLYSMSRREALVRRLQYSVTANSLHRIASVVFCVLAILISPFFFAYQLIEIIRQIPLLVSVLQSVYRNGRSLLVTGLLGVFFIYAYALIAFRYYQEKFQCDNLPQCFGMIVSSLPSNGDALNDSIGGFDGELAFRTSFFIVYVVILNIVLGIIIDTFGQLREERSTIREAMGSKSFMSGIEAQTFELEGISFTDHIKHEQNIWNYIHFYVYLSLVSAAMTNPELVKPQHTRFLFDDARQTGGLVGTRDVIWKRLSKGDITVYPLGKARCLQQRVLLKNASAEQVKQDCRNEAQVLQTSLENVGKRLSEIRERDGFVDKVLRDLQNQTNVLQQMQLIIQQQNDTRQKSLEQQQRVQAEANATRRRR